MSATNTYRSEIWSLLILPSLLFALFNLLSEWGEWDLKLSLWWFELESGTPESGWPWRHSFIPDTLLHGGGHDLVVAIAVIVMVLIGLSWKVPRLTAARVPLSYLLLCFLLTVLLVGVLKSLTHVNCPWDLLPFGGSQIYVPTFSFLPDDVTPGRCFPGGHAAGGYGWIALFFVARVYCPRLRWVALVAVLLLGGSFDLAQQLRGAHFMSHGLWSLMIAWWIAASLYLLWFKRAVKD